MSVLPALDGRRLYRAYPPGPDGAFDVIVIGSGMGGMSCAAALSRLGRRVLVLEQHYLPGGYTHMFARKGFQWDVGVHALGELHEGGQTAKMLAWLAEGEVPMAPLGDPYDRFRFPDDFEIEFPASHRGMVETLRDAFPEQEAALEGALGMPESKEVDGQNEDDLRVKFDQAISRVWQELRSKASPIGLKMPPVVTSEEDFGADPEHGIEAYRIFYSYLRVLRLALRAIIEARVTEMEAPEILAPDYLPVKENADELVCLFHGVSIPVTGSYDSLMRVLAAVQKPGEFLQARLKNVKTVKSRNSEARLLRGDIEFYGFAMVEPIEEEDTSNRSRRGGRRRRR